MCVCESLHWFRLLAHSQSLFGLRTKPNKSILSVGGSTPEPGIDHTLILCPFTSLCSCENDVLFSQVVFFPFLLKGAAGKARLLNVNGICSKLTQDPPLPLSAPRAPSAPACEPPL